jgi:protein SCO1/2
LPGRIGQLVSWTPRERSGSAPIETVTLEDQDGASLTFKEFFTGRPTIVAFFYTRCDNPLKCSLTVAKLATIQRILDERGLADRIQIAGISYDPAFDGPDRLRGYGTERGLRANPRHRLFRASGGIEPLARHFSLGVNFVGSLVNRHRIELFVLDPRGRIAASFERLHWDEQAIVERATALIDEPDDRGTSTGRPANRSRERSERLAKVGALAALAVALFPKCPICWATYLSALGIAGLERIPYSPQLVPLLVAVMVINAGASGLRGYSTGRYAAFALTLAGTVAILMALTFPALDGLAGWGAALNLAGALLTAVPHVKSQGVRAEPRSGDESYLTGAMARTLSSSIE